MSEKLRDTVRREGHARLQRERRQVEEIVVTANITFLGAFVVLLALTETPETWVGYLSAFSLSALVISLLTLLWHRYRQPLRELRWEERRAEISYKSADKIVGFHDTFVKGNPEVAAAVSRSVRAREETGEETDLEDPRYLQTREVFAEMLRAHSEELHRIHREVFNSPLPERRARLLHPLDMFSQRFRYWAFALGMISFLVASILSVLGRP